MKIPKTIKIPRKLKKELKKGFESKAHHSTPNFSSDPTKVSVSSLFHYTYHGSNTKSFFRLCRLMRKEEKRIWKTFSETVWNQNKQQRYVIGFDPVSNGEISDYNFINIISPSSIWPKRPQFNNQCAD